MKRKILLTLLAIVLILRWLYPIWMITGENAEAYDHIFAYPFWSRPAVFDAGVRIDPWSTAKSSLLIILVAYLISRIPGPKPPLIVKRENTALSHHE